MGFFDEIVVWLGKRAVASVMGYDLEISVLRRRVADDPDDLRSLRHLRHLELRAGHDPHGIEDMEEVFTISPASYIRVIERFDRHNYIPGSLRVWAHNQPVVRDGDFLFNERNRELIWQTEPSVDHQIIMRWRQWEPLGDEKPDPMPPPHRRIADQNLIEPVNNEHSDWYG